MEETRRFCEYLTGIRRTEVPGPIISDARYRLLDWSGCAVSGLKSETGKKLLAYVRANGSGGGYPIIGAGGTYPLEMAAMINGAMGHVSEFDDVSKTAIGHPGSVVIPTALMAALGSKRSVQDLLLAVVCGYEAFVRLGRAVCPSHYDNWHTTGTIGTFAAAVTASRLMGLPAAKMQSALGLAATMASGLIASFGTDAKVITVGNAVQNGLTAARLAESGLSGPKDPLEGEGSFLRITSGCYKSDTVLEELGDPLLISTAGYKIYASCGHTHTVLDILFSLLQRYHIQAQEIISMRARVYTVAEKLTATLKTETEAEAKFSLPYCMAVAAIFNEVSLDQFRPAIRKRADVLELAKKVCVQAEPDYDRGYPAERKCSVCVVTGRGSFEKELLLPAARPEDARLESKFFSLVNGCISGEAAEKIRDGILRTEEDAPADKLANLVLEGDKWQAV